jgi:hypothetical protein
LIDPEEISALTCFVPFRYILVASAASVEEAAEVLARPAVLDFATIVNSLVTTYLLG